MRTLNYRTYKRFHKAFMYYAQRGSVIHWYGTDHYYILLVRG